MRILVTSLSFHPEHSGSAPYSTDLAAYFAEKGHDVTVVAPFPFYPSWEKRPEDRGKLFGSETYGGFRILRGYLYVPKNPSAIRRMLHELSFTLFALVNLLRAGRHEHLVVTAAPLPLQLASLVFKRLWRAQLVIHIQDLQSDAALSLGMLRFGGLIEVLARLEAWIYKRASWVATITPSMKENLRKKGVPESKLALYPNWIDVSGVDERASQTPRGEFLSEHPEARGKFVVAYAGNIGVKQHLEALVELAEASRPHDGIHYFIIGEGSRRPHVEALAKGKALTNITFLPLIPPEKYFEMLRDVDVSFVSQKPGSGDVFFPGKLLGIMAMRKPVLVSADAGSELSAVISETGCGLVAVSDDTDALLRNVLSLSESPDLRETLGENGYRHVGSYDRERVLSGFLDRIVRWHKRS